MVRRLQIDAGACLWLALGLLVLPVKWLAAAVAAALFHEICHWTAAKILGIKIRTFTIGSWGCQMETGEMTNWQELLCALAGPFGSMLLIVAVNWMPRLAVCAGMQGLFNLLPVYPLDGGRALKALLRIWIGEEKVDRICRVIEIMMSVLILSVCVVLSFVLQCGMIPLVFALLICIKTYKAKNSLQSGETQGTIELPLLKR